MIMEAMRLSLIDHEEHQKNIHETSKDKGRSSGAATPNSTNAGESSTAGAAGRKRADTGSSLKSQSGASKLFQKLGGRSRSGSLAKVLGQSSDDRSSERRVSFATPGGSGSGTATGSNSPRRSMDRQSITGSIGAAASTTSLSGTAPSATSTSPISTTSLGPSPLNASTTPSTLLGRSPPSSLTPAGGQPANPITTLASHSSGQPASAATAANTSDQAEGSAAAGGLPRLSLDMPALTPDAPRKAGDVSRKSLDLSRRSGERPRNQDDDDAQRPLLDDE